jgi:hypothetical protein
LAINILEIDSIYSKSCSNELLEKAALWDILCLLNKSEFRWLLPFFWSEETHGASNFAKSMAIGYVCFGRSVTLRLALGSRAWLSVANTLRDSQEWGGHPIQERTLFVILKLANQTAYEDVLRDEKENVLFQLRDCNNIASSEERKRAVDRAKQRVRRARNLLTKTGVEIHYLDPRSKNFRKMLLEADRKLSHYSN